MKAMLERVKKFLLMPGGFILTLSFITSLIYFRKLLPELSVRYWPARRFGIRSGTCAAS